MALPGTRCLIRGVSQMHRFWYRLSGGRLGSRLGRVDILLLTTTGRRTGRRWTTPLSYLRDGADLVVIASNGGSDRHPVWYLNLLAQPRATVELRERVLSVTARTAAAEERTRLWPRIVGMYAGYERYQRRTSRQIPVVLLRPEEPG